MKGNHGVRRFIVGMTRRGEDVGEGMLSCMQQRAGFICPCVAGALLDTESNFVFARNARVTVRGLAGQCEYNGARASIGKTLAQGRCLSFWMRGAKSSASSARTWSRCVSAGRRTVPCTQLPPGAMLRLCWREPKQPTKKSALRRHMTRCWKARRRTRSKGQREHAPGKHSNQEVARLRAISSGRHICGGIQASRSRFTWPPPRANPNRKGSHSSQLFILTMHGKFSEREFPWGGEAIDRMLLPMHEDESPHWWRCAAKPWDRAFRRMFNSAGEPALLLCTVETMTAQGAAFISAHIFTTSRGSNSPGTCAGTPGSAADVMTMLRSAAPRACSPTSVVSAPRHLEERAALNASAPAGLQSLGLRRSLREMSGRCDNSAMTTWPRETSCVRCWAPRSKVSGRPCRWRH